MATMQEWQYQAIDPATTQTVKGTMDATSDSAVTAKLRAQGLMPVQVALVEKTGLRREITLPSLNRGVSAKTLAIFARQMSALINAGLPLMRTLNVLADQTSDKRLKAVLTTVSADVESGSSLSAALQRHPLIFPPLMVSIVRVGESGGFLGAALDSIAENYRKQAELHGKIRSATTYPAVVLVIALIGVLVMVTFIVPVFEKMFAGLGGQLPLPTQILVTISHNMIWILPLLVVVIVIAWIWWVRNRYTDGYRRVVDPVKLRLPIFGPLITKMAVARFSRNLSMMLDAGVPIIQALSIVGQASNNWKIEQTVRDIQESIRGGRSFAVPLAKAGVFPPMVSQMVAVGEESGTLAQMLGSIADFYEDEVETATEQLSSLIEPVLIVGLGVIIGGMVISLYLPIFTLYGDIAKQG
ncbi:type II secretion system F family protein [Microbacterium arabinogalactanolyticum]|uniref:type II secretion system F family protein n=1 Tax=Microbacterium arabinogalactanolyticum TaxID=69365 RepID=UPI002556A741|nr:type II secretion system F family protein [Microbacterium arabinogalactanolyticum]GLC86652.1 pilus biosynthesis protein PilC [Microbacterium arabinogalactanolyticum]